MKLLRPDRVEARAPLADADVVARVLAGDDDAYEALVRRHQDSIYRHARGMGLDHDTSLDLVQDAFVKAYTRLGDCHEPERFGAWLFRIARNLCVDHVRNVRQSTVPLSSLADAQEIPDDNHGPSDDLEAVGTALERLSPALREAFLLKHDAGYTYEEIAALTDASPSAVKMRVHRARAALCEFLAEQGITAA
jgi:RNA polymerase sigma-70 factor, ECF subfamily